MRREAVPFPADTRSPHRAEPMNDMEPILADSAKYAEAANRANRLHQQVGAAPWGRSVSGETQALKLLAPVK